MGAVITVINVSEIYFEFGLGLCCTCKWFWHLIFTLCVLANNKNANLLINISICIEGTLFTNSYLVQWKKVGVFFLTIKFRQLCHLYKNEHWTVFHTSFDHLSFELLYLQIWQTNRTCNLLYFHRDEVTFGSPKLAHLQDSTIDDR